ncbi:MAG: hypothetical protein ACRD9R_05205, partial [Pyrinomonadaceae bacterium]
MLKISDNIDNDTPIVIFSGAAYQSDIDAGMLAGANAYLVKPDTSGFIATVKRLLEGACDATPNPASFTLTHYQLQTKAPSSKGAFVVHQVLGTSSRVRSP